ncbi:L,D-transpeptidase [Pseudorhodoplanes sp.]|uniref:L,D-transpeptidase n=1 Tax=Pseudorhodoplanes sp. TaxID=1934341 RepID=UPI00391C7E40
MRTRLCLAVIALAAAVASPAAAEIQITVDKSAQTLTVARDGQVLHTWPVSTGRVGRFTPAGSYQAFRLEEDHYSREFDDAPMPHSIFFTKRGHAIHGSFETRKLGRPASGGCVRLAPENAKRLFEMVKQEGVLKTKVTIVGDERIALARADRELTRGGARAAERGTGLPPTYSPPIEDEPRARQRQATPREAYRPYVYGQVPQQQQYYYDGYRWQPYQGPGQRHVQPQPYYGGGYAQPQYYYRPRYYAE